MKRGLFWAALLFSVASAAQGATLFEELGGREKITAFTSDFGNRLVKDERIKSYFADVDMDHFKDKLTDMFCHLAGEDKPYRGANMKNEHAEMGIRVADFNALIEDLQSAMEDKGISYAAQNRLLALLAPMKKDVVTK